jgi:acetylglutamate kinase
MIPKMESCIDAISHGVSRCHILDGRIPHVLLIELFTVAGVGTMITSQHEEGKR